MMKAILLAAGRGERLQPITDSMPKMLLPVVDRKMIDINLGRLFDSGVSEVGVNLFHQHAILEDHLRHYGKRVRISVEEMLLGTGGALARFKEFIDSDFIMQSGDVLSDIKYADLIALHQRHRPVATIAMVRSKGTKFRIDKNNLIDKIYAYDATPYTYAGIGVFSEKVMSFLPRTDVFSILDVFKNIVKEGAPLVGVPSVMEWYNVNSHYTYWVLHRDMLCRGALSEGPIRPVPVYIDPSSDVRTRDLRGFVSVGENCRIASSVHLENTIVLPGTDLKTGHFLNAVVHGTTRIAVT